MHTCAYILFFSCIWITCKPVWHPVWAILLVCFTCHLTDSTNCYEVTIVNNFPVYLHSYCTYILTELKCSCLTKIIPWSASKNNSVWQTSKWRQNISVFEKFYFFKPWNHIFLMIFFSIIHAWKSTKRMNYCKLYWAIRGEIALVWVYLWE